MKTESLDRDSEEHPLPTAVEYAEAVAEQIHLIRRLYQARLARAYSNAAPDMVYMAGRILDYIGRHPGCVQSEIAAYFRRDKGQVAKIIANLRNQNLIEMQAGSNRRRQQLVLTARGQEIRLRSQQERHHVAQLGVVHLDMAERQLLVDLLDRMRRGLESEPL
ncbi:MarR family winged helix-turn-helix transcriptional regulator [Niveispirillum fermenti]|uniref:MarR family winged helix-turn-helix transcriptional regulator n=1 Tax=Niveispirillum fermenti TaxID=1233113 RepID=UPI003A8B0894